MRNHVRHSRSERIRPAVEEGPERDLPPAAPAVRLAESDDPDDLAGPPYGADADEAFEDDLGDVVRLSCPDCGRPIAVFADEDRLPEHALCPTPWNPFGLTVCAGSGRTVADARPLDGADAAAQQDLVVLLALPAGLDWRTQPFSHVGGPGSRPVRMPEQRLTELTEKKRPADQQLAA